MTETDIEREILELVDEDFYGVWEIAWRLNTVLGMNPEVDPAEVAAVVESLRQRRLVELYVREWVDDGPRPLASSGRSLDLREPSAWGMPRQGEPQFLLGPWSKARSTDAQGGLGG